MIRTNKFMKTDMQQLQTQFCGCKQRTVTGK